MALAFRCSQCGKTYTKGNDWAGKVVNCEGCGKAMRIPVPVAGTPVAAPAAVGPAMAAVVAPTIRRGRSDDDDLDGDAVVRADPARKSSPLRAFFGGLVGVLVVLGMVGRFVIRPYRAWKQAQAVQTQPKSLPKGAMPLALQSGATAAPRGPWRMPAMPEPSDGTLIGEGIEFYEVHLPGGAGGNAPAMPGHSGKLWLYLPEGDHAPASLPCVLIAGAGSKLITGMTLGDGDRPEHLPYVRAGFAVLAYELDGMLPDPEPTDDAHFAPFVRAFADAEAGVVNMRVAVAFATTKVPAIDPKRLYAAGHSSAATLALLVAENEPRIAACVAYAPVVDLAAAIPEESHQAIANLGPGTGQFFTRFNPRTNEANIRCPLFLFTALDDPHAQQIRDFAKRLAGTGKSVRLVTVPRGGHYEPMIKTGIPRAIAWLQSLRQGPNGKTVVPKANTAPRSKLTPRRPSNAPTQPGVRRPRTSPPSRRQAPDQ